MIGRHYLRTAVEPLVTSRFDADALTEAAARRAGLAPVRGQDEQTVGDAMAYLARCEAAGGLRALTAEGARRAELQLADLARERQALEALRICFWWSFWEEALPLVVAPARQLHAAWARCAGGAGQVTQDHLHHARRRAQAAVHAWSA